MYWNSTLRACVPHLRTAPPRGIYGPPSEVSGPPSGQLGNPASAGVSLSIGVGGLLLFGLAAYGVYRLAAG
jgi:hypothetical protein